MAEWDDAQQEQRMKLIWRGAALLGLLLVAGLGAYFYLGFQYKKNIRLLLQEIAALEQQIRLQRRGIERTYRIETPNQDEWFVFYSADYEQTEDATKYLAMPGQKAVADKINEVEMHHARKTYEVFTALQEELAPPVYMDEVIQEYTAGIGSAKIELAKLLKKYPRPAEDKASSLYTLRFALQSHEDALKNLKRATQTAPGSDEVLERLASWRLALYAGKKAYERVEEGL